MIAPMTHAEPLATPLVLRLRYKLQLTLRSTSSSIISILTPTTLAVWRLCIPMKLRMTMPVLPTSHLRVSPVLQLIWLPLHHYSSAEKWDSLGIFHQRMNEMVTPLFSLTIASISDYVRMQVWLGDIESVLLVSISLDLSVRTPQAQLLNSLMTLSAVQATNSVSVLSQLNTDHPHQPGIFSRPNQTLLRVSPPSWCCIYRVKLINSDALT